MRIVFALLRPVYLRYFDSTVRALAERGNAVHLSFSGARTADLGRAEALSRDCPTVTFEMDLVRDEGDPWKRIALGVRLVGDFGRYLSPPFRDAGALRTRAERVMIDALRSSGLPRPARVLSTPVVGYLAAHPSSGTSRVFVGLSRRAERAIPVSRRVTEHLHSLAPDAVVVSPAVDFGSDQVEYLKAARRLRIPAAVCVASWDNLTSKGLLRGDPDAVFVWNELQRREAVRLHGIDPSRVIVTGAPRFDEWFERRARGSAAEFRARIGLEPALPHVVYLCSSAFAAGDEVGFVRRWAEALRDAAAPELRAVGILLRPHPQNSAQWARITLDELSNAVVWPRRGAEVLDDQSKADFYDSIAHSSAVVGRNTSAQIEASIIGRPVLTIVDSGDGAAQLGTLHFHYLRREQGGFLFEASTIEEHLDQLRAAIFGQLDDGRAARRFGESFVRPLGRDVRATDVLIAHIERLAATAGR